MALKMRLRAVSEMTSMCYMRACCDLGYSAQYVNQHEVGQKKQDMLDKIHTTYLGYICRDLSTHILEETIFFHKNKQRIMRSCTLSSIENELMSRILHQN